MKALLSALRQWLELKHVCAWCRRWTGGNPLAQRTTHGICLRCFHKEQARLQERRAREQMLLRLGLHFHP